MKGFFECSTEPLPRWEKNHGFNGKLTIPGTTELLKNNKRRKRKEIVKKRKLNWTKIIEQAKKWVIETQRHREGYTKAKERWTHFGVIKVRKEEECVTLATVEEVEVVEVVEVVLAEIVRNPRGMMLDVGIVEKVDIGLKTVLRKETLVNLVMHDCRT